MGRIGMIPSDDARTTYDHVIVGAQGRTSMRATGLI
jgi:hypothetical protein